MKRWIFALAFCTPFTSCLSQLKQFGSENLYFTSERIYAEILLKHYPNIGQWPRSPNRNYYIYYRSINDLAHLFHGNTIGEIVFIDNGCDQYKDKSLPDMLLDTIELEAHAKCNLFFIDSLPRPWEMWKPGPKWVYVFSPVDFIDDQTAYVRVLDYSHGGMVYSHYKLRLINGRIECLSAKMKDNSIIDDCGWVGYDEWWWGMDRSQ